ncbi:MAG: dephospho-CoA kinase [Gammaproteobacteria bacterium]
MSTRPLVVGVTGGIGCGKSTVCREFAALGAPVVDTDEVAREVVAKGTPGLAAIVARFGPEVLAADGTLDRRRLRSIVFGDDASRQRLEALLHPLIRARTDEHVRAANYPYCLVCIPLLVERKGGSRVDRVLVIDCPEEIQIERVMARDKLTAPEVEAIMRTQATRAARLAVADDVIENIGNVERIRPAIGALHRQYLDLAQRTREPD